MRHRRWHRPLEVEHLLVHRLGLCVLTLQAKLTHISEMVFIILSNPTIIEPVVAKIVAFMDSNNPTAWTSTNVKQLVILVQIVKNFAVPGSNFGELDLTPVDSKRDVSEFLRKLCVPLDADKKHPKHWNRLRNDTDSRLHEVKDGHENHEVYL